MRPWTSYCLALTLLCGTAARAEEPQTDATGTVSDPAFDRYVDVQLLGEALQELDASLAADVTLQLAEGERVLGRPHAEMTADAAFSLALRLATTTHDADTIQRLLTVSKSVGRQEWTTQLDAAQTLLSTSRAPQPPLDVEAMSESGALFASAVLNALTLVQAVGDDEALQDLRAEILASEMLSEPERQALLKYAEGLTEAPAAADAPADDVVSLLTFSTRDEYIPPAGTLALDLDGGQVTTNLAQADLLVANQIGSPIVCPDPITVGSGNVAVQPLKDIIIIAREPTVKITAYKVKTAKVPAGIKGFPPKMTYKTIVVARIPVKKLQVNVGLSLTGGPPKKAILK